MADYKKMYHTLFNKITDVIVELQQVQQQTEEMYIVCEEQIIKLNPLQDEKKDSVSTIQKK